MSTRDMAVLTFHLFNYQNTPWFIRAAEALSMGVFLYISIIATRTPFVIIIIDQHYGRDSLLKLQVMDCPTLLPSATFTKTYNKNNTTIAEFHRQIKPIIDTLGNKSKSAIITGDFNINLLEIDQREIFQVYRKRSWLSAFIHKSHSPHVFPGAVVLCLTNYCYDEVVR